MREVFSDSPDYFYAVLERLAGGAVFDRIVKKVGVELLEMFLQVTPTLCSGSFPLSHFSPISLEPLVPPSISLPQHERGRRRRTKHGLLRTHTSNRGRVISEETRAIWEAHNLVLVVTLYFFSMKSTA